MIFVNQIVSLKSTFGFTMLVCYNSGV